MASLLGLQSAFPPAQLPCEGGWPSPWIHVLPHPGFSGTLWLPKKQQLPPSETIFPEALPGHVLRTLPGLPWLLEPPSLWGEWGCPPAGGAHGGLNKCSCGVPVPQGRTARTAEQVNTQCRVTSGKMWDREALLICNPHILLHHKTDRQTNKQTNTSFIEISLTYYKIYPFKVVFSIYTEVCSHHHD